MRPHKTLEVWRQSVEFAETIYRITANFQFLYMAAGSASEVDTQLEIAFRLGYVDQTISGKANKDLEMISKMLSGLIRSSGSRRI